MLKQVLNYCCLKSSEADVLLSREQLPTGTHIPALFFHTHAKKCIDVCIHVHADIVTEFEKRDPFMHSCYRLVKLICPISECTEMYNKE